MLNLKKIVIGLCAVLMLCVGTTKTAFAYSPQTSFIPLEVLDTFERILTNESPLDRYAAFVNSDHEYILIVGDITKENNTLIFNDVTEYKIIVNDDKVFYSQASPDISSLDISNGLIYSNLGGYPDLVKSDTSYLFYLLLSLIIGFFTVVIGRIFGSRR